MWHICVSASIDRFLAVKKKKKVLRCPCLVSEVALHINKTDLLSHALRKYVFPHCVFFLFSPFLGGELEQLRGLPWDMNQCNSAPEFRKVPKMNRPQPQDGQLFKVQTSAAWSFMVFSITSLSLVSLHRTLVVLPLITAITFWHRTRTPWSLI